MRMNEAAFLDDAYPDFGQSRYSPRPRSNYSKNGKIISTHKSEDANDISECSETSINDEHPFKLAHNEYTGLYTVSVTATTQPKIQELYDYQSDIMLSKQTFTAAKPFDLMRTFWNTSMLAPEKCSLALDSTQLLLSVKINRNLFEVHPSTLKLMGMVDDATKKIVREGLAHCNKSKVPEMVLKHQETF